MSEERSMSITLTGKLIIEGTVRTITGLHIGGAATGLEIGGVDNIVVRNSLDNRPYIPGSSLKGKMRSLLERRLGRPLNRYISRGRVEVRIHECDDEHTYRTCDLCKVFGVAGDQPFATPTRLYVRDVPLNEEDAGRLEQMDTEFPYTEIKWEAAIDRVTSAAVPRQFERVPAGICFSPLQMVFNFYQGDDLALLRRLFEALELLEDDYLGGMGTRGYGRIAFEELTLILRPAAYYAGQAEQRTIRDKASLAVLRGQLDDLVAEIGRLLGED